MQAPVAFPVRKPTSADYAALGAAPKGTPYPHAPFLTAQDESVEVHYVLSNVDKVSHNVWLLIDPWNEFVRWKPGVTIVSDEETIPNNGYDKQYVLGPMSRVEGTITSDDIQEIATKLAAVETFLASPQGAATQSTTADTTDNSLDPTQVCNNIFDYQNRSNSSPPDLIYTPWIPPVIAGLTGVRPRHTDGIGRRRHWRRRQHRGRESQWTSRTSAAIRFVPQDDDQSRDWGCRSKTLSPPAARF